MRAEHEDPEIPSSITEKDLAFGARVELKTLNKENAEFVARHLAMVALLIDSDPELAHLHAVSASRRGGRIAMVRETLAITAYAIGDFALALRELRTYRRISGRDDQLALMIDSERGLGRPDRALELGRSVDLSGVTPQERVNVAIAMSGARLDQGQAELALAELEIEQLDEHRAFDYSPALFTAYAEVLRELGREPEAKRWDALATRAADALAAAAHDEHETINVLSEALEGEELEAYIEKYGPLEDADADAGDDSSDAQLDEPLEAKPEVDAEDSAADDAETDEAPMAEEVAESSPAAQVVDEPVSAEPVSAEPGAENAVLDEPDIAVPNTDDVRVDSVGDDEDEANGKAEANSKSDASEDDEDNEDDEDDEPTLFDL